MYSLSFISAFCIFFSNEFLLVLLFIVVYTFLSQACNGFSNMYTSKMELVPRNEVPGLLSVQNMPTEIADGMWVRIKNGKYKGDLAQVLRILHELKLANFRHFL